MWGYMYIYINLRRAASYSQITNTKQDFACNAVHATKMSITYEKKSPPNDANSHATIQIFRNARGKLTHTRTYAMHLHIRCQRNRHLRITSIEF